MKSYSDSAVTKSDLSFIDQKQARQIARLKVGLVLVFVNNLAVSVGIYVVTH